MWDYRERGDELLLEEFFNSLKKKMQRSKFKRSKNAVHNMPEQRPADHPADRHAQRAHQQLSRLLGRPRQGTVDRSGRSTVMHQLFVGDSRPTGRSKEGVVDRPIYLSYQDLNSVSDLESNPIVVS